MSIERRTVLKGGAATTLAAVAGGPFQGLLGSPASAAERGAPFRVLRPIPDERDGQVRLHLPKGFSYRSFHDTEFPVTLDDGTALPGRHDGMGAFRGPTATSSWSGTTRSPTRRTPRRSGRARRTTPGRRRHDDRRGDPVRRSGQRLHEPERDDVQLQRRRDAVGLVDHLRGDGQRTRRRSRLHRSLQRRAERSRTATSSRCRTTARATDSRSPEQGASRTRRSRSTRSDGILYLTEDNFEFPSGFYRYIPKKQPDEDRTARQRGPAADARHQGPAEHPPRGAAAGPGDVQGRVGRHRRPQPDVPLHARRGGADYQRRCAGGGRRPGACQGAALFSRLEGQVYDDGVVYFTSTQGGGPQEDDTDDDNAERLRSRATGRSGPTTPGRRRCRSSTRRPSTTWRPTSRSTSPTTSPRVPRGTLVVCEDSTVDNYIRGLSRGGQLWDIALNRLVSQLTGLPRFGDEFAGSTFSPGGHTLFVNIQASRGMSFAIWGPWHRIGV